MSTASGVYGVRLSLPDPSGLLVDAPSTWPRMEITHSAATSWQSEPMRIEGSSASLPLGERGRVDLSADPLTASFTIAEDLAADELIHPLVAPAAAVAAHWRGDEPLHAGAIVGERGAWLVIGEKGAGKSSMVAALYRAGFPVVADDLTIFTGTSVVAGPRCIDLRADAAAHFGVGNRVLRTPEPRWRVGVAPVAPEVELAGWIMLEWGDAIATHPIDAANRLATLGPHRSLPLEPRDPRILLELAARPAYRLARPRSWADLDQVVERVGELMAAGST